MIQHLQTNLGINQTVVDIQILIMLEVHFKITRLQLRNGILIKEGISYQEHRMVTLARIEYRDTLFVQGKRDGKSELSRSSGRRASRGCR